MRDLYKLVLLVPVVIILSLFLFRFQGGDGELEFYANGTNIGASSGIALTEGSGIDITATRGSHDVTYEISSTSSAALAYSAHQPPSTPADPTLTIQGDATMDVALNYPFGGDTTRPVYTLGVDVPSLAAAVGQPAALDVWDPHYSPIPPATDQYRPLRELRIDVQAPFVLNHTRYDDSEDEMIYTLQLDGGTNGQLITGTGTSSNPAYEDLDLSIEGRTATQLEVTTSSPGTNATIPAATSTEAGLMSAVDKATVDSLMADLAQLRQQIADLQAGRLPFTWRFAWTPETQQIATAVNFVSGTFASGNLHDMELPVITGAGFPTFALPLSAPDSEISVPAYSFGGLPLFRVNDVLDIAGVPHKFYTFTQPVSCGTPFCFSETFWSRATATIEPHYSTLYTRYLAVLGGTIYTAQDFLDGPPAIRRSLTHRISGVATNDLRLRSLPGRLRLPLFHAPI